MEQRTLTDAERKIVFDELVHRGMMKERAGYYAYEAPIEETVDRVYRMCGYSLSSLLQSRLLTIAEQLKQEGELE